jgi:hypothetical protein
MGFMKKDVDKFLSDIGRRCCICGLLHKVQIHHIVPKEQGGADDIDNAIALCPNCHNEVHASYASGQVTRIYSFQELRQHRKRTIEIVTKASDWTIGNAAYNSDKKIIEFYAQCLDRAAFHTPFHTELSFADFDQAVEDTILAINTGYWRTRDGAVIGRSKGKSCIVNPDWRGKLDSVVQSLENVRSLLRKALSLDSMMYTTRADMSFLMDRRLRDDRDLRQQIDTIRNDAINIFNSVLTEIGHQPLKAIPVW